MAELCASILVVLGTAWVVREALSAGGRPPRTAFERRLWVCGSLLAALGVQGLLVVLGAMPGTTLAVPAALLVAWLVVCRVAVRPRRTTTGRRPSPVGLSLAAASVIVCWVALNPMGSQPEVAVAATTPDLAASRVPEASTVPPAEQPLVGEPGTITMTDEEQPRIVMATKGAIVYVGDRGQLTANTGPTSSSGAVALGVEGSRLRAGDSSAGGAAGASGRPGTAAAGRTVQRRTTTAGRLSGSRVSGSRVSGSLENSTVATLSKKVKGSHGTSLSGFEDHSVSVDGDDQVVTYDDSNVFIDRLGLVNANTGDTDSSGLNAVDVVGSTVRAGNSGDGESGPDDEEEQDAVSASGEAEDARQVPAPAGGDEDDGEESGEVAPGVTPSQGQAYGTVTDEGASTATGKKAFVVGADGFDDVSIRSRGHNDVVTYDDSNVTIGGEGKVNAQIGDSDTGGGVVMGIRDSDVRAGCAGDLCYSKAPALTVVARILHSAGVQLSPKQWRELLDVVGRE